MNDHPTDTYALSPDERARLFDCKPCPRCGHPTPFPGATQCHSCWTIEQQIPARPEIAAQILRECGYTVSKSVYRGMPHA